MQFENWQAFFAMGGYGLFVWLSFGAFAALMLGSYVVLKVQRRNLLSAIRAEQARRKRIEASKG
ncbi:heme exporter protein CcmD [Bowmanella sp. JS7-9]|uniref:Heme exporter protein D n=1 Tax=Pseudobowmanella zhangzhouensis TaxID=1537679 RepID=A0ABW1XGR0_9ALTE|nr:heme exporter protein CcmD [Bowmanella sp. JS7-9]TBX25830.1 hypothetical protein TK45_03915 [Bowmanella sp. JS7-9]